MFDGLEDIFPNIALNSQEKIALKSLIEDIPNKLSEIRQSNLGAIVFLRRDFLRHAIAQNLKQFEHLYRAYDLSWNQDSFLRLVFWLSRQSEVITENDIINIDSLAGEDLVEPQPGNFYGGWITKDIVGPFKGSPGTWGW